MKDESVDLAWNGMVHWTVNSVQFMSVDTAALTSFIHFASMFYPDDCSFLEVLYRNNFVETKA